MMGEMSSQYLIVEPRYKLGLYEAEGVSVFMTSMLELLVQSPLCLAVYYGYHRNRPWRHGKLICNTTDTDQTRNRVSSLHFAHSWSLVFLCP
jgi:hypothetical protein